MSEHNEPIEVDVLPLMCSEGHAHNFATCSECGALVELPHVELHERFHLELRAAAT